MADLGFFATTHGSNDDQTDTANKDQDERESSLHKDVVLIPDHYVPLDQIEFLRPAERIRQYAQSSIAAHRVYIARSLFKILPRITRQSTFNEIMPHLNALAVDSDRSVRVTMAGSLGELLDAYGNAQSYKKATHGSSDSLVGLMESSTSIDNDGVPLNSTHITEALHLSTTPFAKVTTYLPDHFLTGIVLPLLLDSETEVSKTTREALVRATIQSAFLDTGSLRLEHLNLGAIPPKRQLSTMVLEWVVRMTSLTAERAEMYVEGLRKFTQRGGSEHGNGNGYIFNGASPDLSNISSSSAAQDNDTSSSSTSSSSAGAPIGSNGSSSSSSSSTTPAVAVSIVTSPPTTARSWKPQFIDHTSAYANGDVTYNGFTEDSASGLQILSSADTGMQSTSDEEPTAWYMRGLSSGLLFVMNHESGEEREAREKSLSANDTANKKQAIQRKVEAIRGIMLEIIGDLFRYFRLEQVKVILSYLEKYATSECINERGKTAEALIIAARLPPNELEERALPLIKALANDTIYHVRRAIAQILPMVVPALPYELKVKHMIPLVDSLATDISRTVRDAMYNGIAYCIVAFAQDTQATPAASSVASDHGSDNGDANSTSAIRDTSDADTIHSFLTFTSEPHSEGFLDTYDSFTTVCNQFARPHNRRDSVLPAIPPRAVLIDRIPPSFLQCFMLSTMRWKEPDRIAKCAYYIPGVIYTLGPDCWAQLRGLYLTLCGDQNVDVRRPLVKSFHIVAQVLGSDVVNADFRGIIDLWLQDADEVRVPLLRRIPYVLQYASQEMRDVYKSLPVDTLKAEEALGRWRVRKAIATTIHLWWQLYSDSETLSRLSDCLLTVLTDRVERVRMSSLRCLDPIFSASLPEDVADLTQRLAALATSKAHISRIMFVYATKEIVLELPEERQDKFLDHIGRLATDTVAGVRIVIAKWIVCAHEDCPEISETKLHDRFKSLRETLMQDSCSTVVELVS
ncbi:hypothetical protein RI367_000107 [Sorochytrium milnesiophthora]